MNQLQRVDGIMSKMLIHMKMFAGLAMNLEVVENESIPTACTDSVHLKFNPKWFETLKDDMITTVITEEVLHCGLGHHWRCPDKEWTEDPQLRSLWNQACDQEARQIMVEYNKIRASQGMTQLFEFPCKEDMPNPQFASMPAEAIYSILKQMQNKSNGGQKPQNGGQGGSGGSQSKGDQPGNDDGSQDQQPKSSGRPGSFGEIEKPVVKAGVKDDEENKHKWAGRMANAVRIEAASQGMLPGNLMRLVEEIKKTKVPWWEVMRNFCRRSIKSKCNWSVPNRRYLAGDFILPTRKSKAIGRIAFAKDTSVSIYPELLAKMVAEQKFILEELKPVEMIDYCCDARVHQKKVYVPGDEISPKAPGGGGTDFCPVFDDLAKYPEPIECLIYMTDLYGSFPSEPPPYPVLWVTPTQNYKVPFGELVIAEL